MNIVITALNKPGYLLIESKGELKTEADLKEHCKMIFDEILKHNAKKVLIDEPGTRFPKDLFAYYNVVKYYLDNFPPEIHFLKIAVVISEEFKKMGSFWETVCVNMGLQYFAFTSFRDAHDWLVAKTADD